MAMRIRFRKSTAAKRIVAVLVLIGSMWPISIQANQLRYADLQDTVYKALGGDLDAIYEIAKVNCHEEVSEPSIVRCIAWAWVGSYQNDGRSSSLLSKVYGEVDLGQHPKTVLAEGESTAKALHQMIFGYELEIHG